MPRCQNVIYSGPLQAAEKLGALYTFTSELAPFDIAELRGEKSDTKSIDSRIYIRLDNGLSSVSDRRAFTRSPSFLPHFPPSSFLLAEVAETEERSVDRLQAKSINNARRFGYVHAFRIRKPFRERRRSCLFPWRTSSSRHVVDVDVDGRPRPTSTREILDSESGRWPSHRLKWKRTAREIPRIRYIAFTLLYMPAPSFNISRRRLFHRRDVDGICGYIKRAHNIAAVYRSRILLTRENPDKY
jgi:hypothetical protein